MVSLVPIKCFFMALRATLSLMVRVSSWVVLFIWHPGRDDLSVIASSLIIGILVSRETRGCLSKSLSVMRSFSSNYKVSVRKRAISTMIGSFKLSWYLPSLILVSRSFIS